MSKVNYANLLTFSRFVAAPIYVWALWRHSSAWAIGAMGYAALADFLDGWVARNICCTSDLGELLDAVGDVFIFLTGILAGAVLGYVSWWPVIVLLSGGAVSAYGRMLYARKLGRAANYKSRPSEFLGGAAFALLLVYAVDFYTEYHTWLLALFTWWVAIRDVREIVALPPGQEVE